MALDVLTPLITSQIASVESVVISKKDEATETEMTFARQTIEGINPAAPIYSVANK